MAIKTYRTEWGSETVEISADFAQASCQVVGTNGRQVADFDDPEEAMDYAIAQLVRAEGRAPEECEEEIWEASANMVEVMPQVTASKISLPLSEIADEATSNVEDSPALDPADDDGRVIVENSTGNWAIVDGFHRVAGMVRWCEENDVELDACEITVIHCETESVIAAAAETGPDQQDALEAIFAAAE